MPFNPFNKAIHEPFIADDLQQLITNQVSEGYYVEYKGDIFPSNEKIGRSIASFANSYGGWYVVGVKTDSHNVANEICGFDVAKYPDPISKVREIAKSHIDPVPVFHPKVVQLDSGKATLVVYIPGEQETPFITKDGRIYRRVSDSSDPIPETSRYTIDQLVNSGQKIEQEFIKFCKDERTFSKSEDKVSWINIYLSPYPLGVISRWDLLDEDTLVKLIEQSKLPHDLHFGDVNLSGTIPFNSVHTTPSSVIFEQSSPTREAFNSITLELFTNGRARIHLPLEYLPPLYDLNTIKSSVTKQVLNEVVNNSPLEHNLDLLRFFRFDSCWKAIVSLLGFYHKWLGDDHPITDIKTAIALENVWRSVPFFDHDAWGEHVKKFGVPIIKSSSITIPRNLNKGMLISVTDKRQFWIELSSYIGLGFGLPLNMLDQAIMHALLEIAAASDETNRDTKLPS